MSVIDELVTELARLPGIGKKTALRLTYHLLRQPQAQSQRLAQALENLTDRVRSCSRCHNFTEAELCDLCSDPRRDGGIVCVVEQPADIASVERAGTYRGLYHVLGGRLSPLDGVGPNDLTIAALLDRLDREQVQEVILATNPSVEGEATALYIQRQLVGRDLRITRIARGLPLGGDLEFADGGTIAQALSARREM